MTTNPALPRRLGFLLADRVPPLRRALIETVHEWQRRSRSRSDLMALGERDLWDIRLSRVDAEQEARKPFWRE
jgi:uncharacterized protein YjiS (DUF1127 family)